MRSHLKRFEFKLRHGLELETRTTFICRGRFDILPLCQQYVETL